MAKRVYFSFHYEDVKTFRANVVRNHGFLKDVSEAGFHDASIWEEAKRQGSYALKRLINSSLEYTTVSCTLIGSQTHERPWVRYEILKSFDRGNTLFGVHINSIKDRFGYTYTQGRNPFDQLGFYIDDTGYLKYYERGPNGEWQRYTEFEPSKPRFDQQYRNKGYTLSQWVPTYDWVTQAGYYNFKTWVDNAK